MLSTSDNPYNPWLDYDNWYAWDEAHGYHTCSYLARMSNTLGDLSEDEADQVRDLAIESILNNNITGNYVFIPEPN